MLQQTIAVLLVIAVVSTPGQAAELPGESPAELPVGSDPTAEATAERLFANEVLPLLHAKCFACHGADPDELQGEFDLSSRAGLVRGGESGDPAIVVEMPGDSPLVKAVLWDGLEMPPKENDRLTAAQVDVIRRWIQAGAPWPAAVRLRQLQTEHAKAILAGGELTTVATSGGTSTAWTNRSYAIADLWAFQPLSNSLPLPVAESAGTPAIADDSQASDSTSNDSTATVHPIDAFVLRRISQTREEPLELHAATRRELIRRMTLDLTGLTPTAEQVAEFEAGEGSAAIEKLIDRLLSSQHYGERWAQHWLDVVRYADTAGFANDFERPHVWRYRDYVIRSLNKDKSFDRFLREQVAGDELDSSDPDCVLGSGFLRLGPWEHTGMAVEQLTRQNFLDDVTNSVGETFLGINLTCCKCHDHKFDPLPTKDYYRFQAIFAPTQFGDRALPFQADENTDNFATGTARVEKLLAEAKAFRKSLTSKLAKAKQALLVEYQVKKFNQLPGEVQQKLGRFAGLTDLEKSLQKVNNKRIAYYERELARFRPFAFSVYNGPFHGYAGIQNQVTVKLPAKSRRKGAAQVVHVLRGGALETPGEVVQAGVLSLRMTPHNEAAKSHEAANNHEDRSFTQANAGRRLALADWLLDDMQHVTARVMVNRVWHYHFGSGLFKTPNAVGKMGAKPTHPELLDYLARRFMKDGWSLKKLHRLILTSQTYQRSATPPAGIETTDPDNNLLTYFPSRRLSAEELRDSLLAITGELNAEMGGPGCYPEINWDVALQPRQIMGTVAPAYQPSRTPAERNRRTIYAVRIRTLADPLLEVFNRPGTDFSCAARDETTVTPQVFSLFNGQFAHDRAIALAVGIATKNTETQTQISAAFQLILQRNPSADELTASLEHFELMLDHHQMHQPTRVPPPTSVKRGMVEELTGELYEFEDRLTLMDDYVPDTKPWDVDATTRALAELCLVLINTNEFAYVY